MSAPRTKAVRLRPDQWQTVVACLVGKIWAAVIASSAIRVLKEKP